jgi:hypothetical protein
MRGHGWLTAALMCAVGVLATGTAQAAPTWLAPFDVSAPDGQAGEVGAAMAADGTVWAAWSTSDAEGNGALALATRPPGGPPAKLGPIAAGGAPAHPSLTVAADGTLVAGWLDIDPNTGDTLVRVGRRAGDGSVPAVTLAREDAADLEVASGASGVVAAAWSAGGEGSGTIHVRISRDNGVGWGPVRTLSTDNDATDPGVAVAPDGTVVVAWARLDDDGAGRIKLASIFPNDAVSGVAVVSPAGDDAGEPAVAASPSLGTVVAWTAVDSAENGRVKVDAIGDAVPAAVVPSAGDQSAPALALDAGGNLWVAWAAENNDASQIFAATRSALAYGAPAVISGGDPALVPHIAFDGAGNGVAVWRKPADPTDPAAGGDVRAAGYDAAGPAITAFAVPAQATAGSPAAFSIRATDVWSPVGPAAWDFGDGATASGDDVSHTYAAPGPKAVSATVTDAAGNAASQSGGVDVRPAAATSSTTPSSSTPPATTAAQSTPPPALRLDGFAKNFACVRFDGSDGGTPGFTFTLSEAATVTLELRRRVPSMTLTRCPGPPAKKIPGTYAPALTVDQAAGPGASTVSFGGPGRLDQASAASVHRHRGVRRGAARRRATAGVRTRALPSGRFRLSLARAAQAQQLAPGTYLATVTARTADGRTATTGHLKFWILDSRP